MGLLESGRFELRRLIGKGTYGLVYEAYDRERCATIALKTLRLINADALYRFKREFRVLSEVNHPNLVRLYELFVDEEQWFFTMELVHGEEFVKYFRQLLGGRSPAFDLLDVLPVTPPRLDGLVRAQVEQALASGRFPTPSYDLAAAEEKYPPSRAVAFTRLRRLTRQLAEGLLALHRTGQLHRDIKPTNVLITPEERVVLLDFGLVTDLKHPTFPQTPRFAGTPHYMSPEQGLGQSVTEATDWYAVGVMLYEALTGQLPFPGNALEVLADKHRDSPPGPLHLVKELPEDLAELCNALLHRQADRRPQGPEIVQRLLGPDEREDALWDLVVPRRGAKLVGRVSALDTLGRALNCAQNGEPAVVYLRGEHGVGKTALARHFVDQLHQQQEQALVLEGRCRVHELVPYRALDGLVDQLCRYLRTVPPNELRSLLPSDTSGLDRLFPVFNRVNSIAQGARRRDEGSGDSLDLYLRAADALRRLLRGIATRRPLVLCLDDLQWGDADSARLLAHLLAARMPPPLLLLACFRDGGGHPMPFVDTLERLLDRRGHGVERFSLDLSPLPAAQARTLARKLLADAPRTVRRHSRELAQRSGGNPLVLSELAHLVRSEVQTAGAAPGETGDDAAAAEEAPNPGLSLVQVVRRRVDRLPGRQTRKLLEVLAVAGRPEPLEVVLRAAKFPQAPTRTLFQLRRCHLVHVLLADSGDALELASDAMARALLADLPEQRRMALHRRLAMAMEELGGAPPESIANHFEAAGEPERALEYVFQAADRALEGMAFARAADLYQRGLDGCAEGDPARGRLLVRWARALEGCNRLKTAGQTLLQAVELVPEQERTALLRRASRLLLRAGHIPQGMAALGQLMERLGLALPATSQQAMVALLRTRATLALRGFGLQERPVEARPTAELEQVDACWTAGEGLVLANPVLAGHFQSRALLLALRAGDPWRAARGLYAEALFRLYRGQPGERIEKVLRQADAVAEPLSSPYLRALGVELRAHTAFFELSLGEVHPLVERAEGLYLEQGDDVRLELDRMHWVDHLALLWQGELATLGEQVDRRRTAPRPTHDLVNDYLGAFLNAWLELAADRPGHATDELDRLLPHWPQDTFLLPHWLHLWAHVEALLYRGMGRTALELFARHRAEIWGVPLRGMRLVPERAAWLEARAALATAREAGEQPKGELLRLARKQARTLDQRKDPWASGTAATLLAGVALLQGADDDAAALLARAEARLADSALGLQLQAVRFARGGLLGGDEGETLQREAQSWLGRRGISRPELLCSSLVPLLKPRAE